MTTFYVESEALSYKKTKEILDQYKDKQVIIIDKYSEIFNRNNQNFKKQKLEKSFILAIKKNGFVQKNPEYCASCLKENYYFSTSLNCIFDCEYCFLQGMYMSAYILLFVNIDDFKKEIDLKLENQKSKTMFFAGYDNDCLALDNITKFSKDFIPWFELKKNTYLELRTKSSNISELKKLKPSLNTIISFTLSPETIQKQYEKWSCSLKKRIKALNTLQSLNWLVAIRIEPIIYSNDYVDIYSNFFAFLKKEIDFSKVENIYFGVFKIPKLFLKKMKKLHPYSKLLHRNLYLEKHDQMTYKKEILEEIEKFILEKCVDLIWSKKVFYSESG